MADSRIKKGKANSKPAREPTDHELLKAILAELKEMRVIMQKHDD